MKTAPTARIYTPCELDPKAWDEIDEDKPEDIESRRVAKAIESCLSECYMLDECTALRVSQKGYPSISGVLAGVHIPSE